MSRLEAEDEKTPYLSAEVQRLAQSSLYFLAIDGGRMHKIGVTLRPVADRVAEIQRDLPGQQAIEVLRFIPAAGAIEPYFKWLFQDRVVRGTEYFTGLNVDKVLADLDRAAGVNSRSDQRW